MSFARTVLPSVSFDRAGRTAGNSRNRGGFDG